MEILDFGLKDYEEVLNLQHSFFDKLILDKKSGILGSECILIGEHPPVITLGRRARNSNVLLSENELQNKGIKTFKIGRGGDVTYHCPGQIILYPIIDLDRHHLGVKEYVDLLEESVIRLLADYNIKGERINGATGVWIEKNTPNERKICAIGIRCSHFCTMHGLSLNVNSDLSGFRYINPCGFIDKGVTSIAEELKVEPEEIEIKKLKKELIRIFLSLLS